MALWREGLLAQAVLAGRTRGYTNHPQLARFRAARDPLAAIATYLAHVAREGWRRSYSFDESRLGVARTRARLRVTDGQLCYEFAHLGAKLRRRNPGWVVDAGGVPVAHPLFIVVGGGVAEWERAF